MPPLSSVPGPTGSTSYANSNARAGPPPINTNLNSGAGGHRTGGGYTSGAGSSGPSGPYQFPLRPVALSESSTPSLVPSVNFNDEAQISKREEVGKLVQYVAHRQAITINLTHTAITLQTINGIRRILCLHHFAPHTSSALSITNSSLMAFRSQTFVIR